MRIIFTLFFALDLAFMLTAINITVSNLSLTGKNTTDHYILVQFDISRENSWRTSSDPFFDPIGICISARKSRCKRDARGNLRLTWNNFHVSFFMMIKFYFCIRNICY